ncbi:MAG: DUF4179 domain-containing protein [Clostridium sp.]|uniref:DUF4179 domain-containing protein n=1 Tax=Clostridium sp. TaxID=1506 RepID=UPI003F32E529
MDFKEFDKKMKKAIKDEVDEIPDGVNKKIDRTLQELGKKKDRNYIKRGIIVASTVLLLGAASVTTTAVANGIGIKDLVYKIFGYDEVYTKYEKEINKEMEYDGVRGTVISAIHDGYKMYITFKLESDTLSASEIKQKTAPSIKVIGNEYEEYEAELRWKEEDGKKVVGIFEVGLSNVRDGKNSMMGHMEDIEVEFSLSQYVKEEHKDDLKFKIKASAKDIKDEIKRYKINKKINDIQIKEVIVTPFDIYVKGENKVGKSGSDDSLEKEKSYTYKLKDNSGVIIESTGDDIGCLDRKEFTIEFKNTSKDISKLELLIENKGKEIKREILVGKKN